MVVGFDVFNSPHPAAEIAKSKNKGIKSHNATQMVIIRNYTDDGTGGLKDSEPIPQLRIRIAWSQESLRPNREDRVSSSEGGIYEIFHIDGGFEHTEGEECDGGGPGRYLRSRSESHGDWPALSAAGPRARPGGQSASGDKGAYSEADQ